MFVNNVEYCDFCVCTFSSDESSFHIERVSKDPHFWEDCLVKAQTFFKTCILQELLGKWYTRPSPSVKAGQRNQQEASVSIQTTDTDGNGHQSQKISIATVEDQSTEQ